MMSACIVAAQLVMLPIALLVGRTFQAEIGAVEGVVGVQGGDRALETDAAAFEGEDAVGEIQEGDVLLGDQQGRPLGAEAAEHVDHLAHQQGREAGGGLVHDQHARGRRPAPWRCRASCAGRRTGCWRGRAGARRGRGRRRRVLPCGRAARRRW